MAKEGKLLIFSAPSGSGKTTLVKYIMNEIPELRFSVSATSRPARGNEKNGIEYYFLTAEDFRERINANEFVEWEEVYNGRFYGTLRSEVERIRNQGTTVVFDVDVIGGLNIKKLYKDDALAIFIKAPDINTLRERLISRDTDNYNDIKTRIDKAEYELTFADKFDVVIINDDLEKAKKQTLKIVKQFISNK